MTSIDPKEIPGAWNEGYALDQHTVSSDFLGYNEFGHEQFDTTRSEVGELLYRLKYKGDSSAVPALVEAAARYYRIWHPNADMLAPVPPSNEKRRNQPVMAIARPLSEELGIEFCTGCVTKIKSTEQLKSIHFYAERMAELKEAFEVDADTTRGRKILLFDDLYRSGATMNAITKLLYDPGGAKSVYALTITKTRSRS